MTKPVTGLEHKQKAKDTTKAGFPDPLVEFLQVTFNLSKLDSFVNPPCGYALLACGTTVRAE